MCNIHSWQESGIGGNALIANHRTYLSETYTCHENAENFNSNRASPKYFWVLTRTFDFQFVENSY